MAYSTYFLSGCLLILFIFCFYLLRHRNILSLKYEQKVNELAILTYKLQVLEESKENLKDTFEAVSAKALEQNNQHFMALATSTFDKLQTVASERLSMKEKSIDAMIKPIEQSLKGVDLKLQDLEKERSTAYHLLRQQVSDLISGQKDLRDETSNLVKALRTPHIRGRWGEIQLKRVIEMSGMSAHCDFVEQETIGEEGARFRPDVIVKLPGDKSLIIDAKAPLSAFLDALEAKDEGARKECLQVHARHIRAHIQQLSKRSYHDTKGSEDSPEFVILFLPGETFFTEALAHDPDLIEWGVSQHVILTTPATLIALLHAVAYGWRQEKVSENAKEISALGQELYKRLCDMGGHISKLGGSLNQSVNNFNRMVGSLESRVFPSARKFKQLDGTGAVELENIEPIEQQTRPLLNEDLSIFPNGGDSQTTISLVKSMDNEQKI